MQQEIKGSNLPTSPKLSRKYKRPNTQIFKNK